jgi:hypothetical protein
MTTVGVNKREVKLGFEIQNAESHRVENRAEEYNKSGRRDVWFFLEMGESVGVNKKTNS